MFFSFLAIIYCTRLSEILLKITFRLTLSQSISVFLLSVSVCVCVRVSGFLSKQQHGRFVVVLPLCQSDIYFRRRQWWISLRQCASNNCNIYCTHTIFENKIRDENFFWRDNEDSRRLLIITCLLLVDFHYQAALIAYPKAIYECFCVCVHQVWFIQLWWRHYDARTQCQRNGKTIVFISIVIIAICYKAFQRNFSAYFSIVVVVAANYELNILFLFYFVLTSVAEPSRLQPIKIHPSKSVTMC